MVEVAVAQFAPGEDKARNLEAARGFIAEAAGRGARVVLLPEYAMFTAPRMDARYVDAAEPLDGPFAAGIAAAAAEHGVYAVVGLVVALADTPDRISNTLAAFSPEGQLAASYRKLHLYDAFGATESDTLVAGPIEEPETFTADGVTFGVQTCYDLRFPEVSRRIADAGAQVLLLAAQWVPGPLKEDHWTTLLRARAIENTLYVAAAGQNAPRGSGRSMVVDPLGTAVAALGEETGVALARIRPERIDEVRKVNPSLALRRFTVAPRP